MPFKRLQAAKEKTIGSKQTAKALKKDQVKVVYFADNAEKHVINPIIKVCEDKNVTLIRVDTMKNLGKACGIKVECAVAAIINE